MKIIAVIPLEDVVTMDVNMAGYVFVVSRGFLTIYKQVKP